MTTGRGLAWYLVGWAALSAVLVIAVMWVDWSPSDSPARPSRESVGGLETASPARSGGNPAQRTQQMTAAVSRDWTLDLSYTPVQSHHRGRAVRVTGCPRAFCGRPADLGSYPNEFVEAVRAQGTGKITAGAHAGKYLGWAASVGYWLDTAPRDSHGNPLRAYLSASSGSPLLSLRTRLRILSCGVDESGGSNAAVCAKLKASTWRVVEVPNPGPTRSLTLYIGLETSSGFAASAWNTTFSHAMLRIG